MNEAFNLEGYTTEVTIPEGSPLVGKTVGEVEKLSEGDVEVLTLIRARDRVNEPAAGHQAARRPHADSRRPAGRAEAADGRGQAQAGARREHRRDRRARRRYRRHGSDRHGGFAAGRPLGHAIPALRASPGEPAGGQPQRPPHPAPDRLDAAQARRRHRPAGQSQHDAGGARRTALPAAGAARHAARPRPPRPAAGGGAGGRDAADGAGHRAGRHRVLRRGGRDPADPGADAARGLRGDRVAAAGHAGRAHPGQRRAAHHRRHRPDRRLAVVPLAGTAADRRRWR